VWLSGIAGRLLVRSRRVFPEREWTFLKGFTWCSSEASVLDKTAGAVVALRTEVPGVLSIWSSSSEESMKLVACLWSAEVGLTVLEERAGEAINALTGGRGSGVWAWRSARLFDLSIRGDESRNCCRDNSASNRLLAVNWDGTRFTDIGGGRVPAAAGGPGRGWTVCAA
jgi:hypothetical protein